MSRRFGSPPREHPAALIRRWWRSRYRFRGLDYWIRFHGIPLLTELSPTYSVPNEFPDSFVEYHMSQDTEGEAHWVVAQRHWEIVVERVLDSDAVSDNADQHRAIRQAVLAASVLLSRLIARGRTAHEYQVATLP